MDKFIHRENIMLYRKRLEEPHTAGEREVLLKLLAEEEKREAAAKKEKIGILYRQRNDGCS